MDKKYFSFFNDKNQKKSDSNSLISKIKLFPFIKEYRIYIITSGNISTKEKYEYPKVLLDEVFDRVVFELEKDGWTCVCNNEFRDYVHYQKVTDIHSALKCIAIDFDRDCTESDYEDFLYPKTQKIHNGIFHYEIPENLVEEISQYCFNLKEDSGKIITVPSSSDLGKKIIQTLAQNIAEEEYNDVLKFKDSLYERLLSIKEDSLSNRDLEEIIENTAKEVVAEFGIPYVTFQDSSYSHIQHVIIDDLLYNLGLSSTYEN